MYRNSLFIAFALAALAAPAAQADSDSRFLPCGGEIRSSLLAIIKSHTLGAGEFESEYDTGTRMCMCIVSKHALINQYGLRA